MSRPVHRPHSQYWREPILIGLVALVLFAIAPMGTVSAGDLQPARGDHAEPAGGAHGEAAAHEEAAEHEDGGLWDLVARLVNFGILVGALVYLLRTPIASHLRQRATEITSDLATAATTQGEAARQIEEIDRKLAALPQELEALRKRGAEEVAAEDVRIRQAAEVERQRVLEQARREIDMHARIARRELTEHAAELATGLAARRLQQTMTKDDHLRLVDRFASQVRTQEPR